MTTQQHLAARTATLDHDPRLAEPSDVPPVAPSVAHRPRTGAAVLGFASFVVALAVVVGVAALVARLAGPAVTSVVATGSAPDWSDYRSGERAADIIRPVHAPDWRGYRADERDAVVLTTHEPSWAGQRAEERASSAASLVQDGADSAVRRSQVAAGTSHDGADSASRRADAASAIAHDSADSADRR